jgi:hypothetical protein
LFETAAPALGLKELADRISVEELFWERQNRSNESAPQRAARLPSVLRHRGNRGE